MSGTNKRKRSSGNEENVGKENKRLNSQPIVCSEPNMKFFPSENSNFPAMPPLTNWFFKMFGQYLEKLRDFMRTHYLSRKLKYKVWVCGSLPMWICTKCLIPMRARWRNCVRVITNSHEGALAEMFG
jgi:hypothetical protein